MPDPDIAELLPATHVRPGATDRTARIVLPAAMVLAMLLSSIGISTWAYLAHREEALRRADDLIASLEQRIQAQVRAYLLPVAELVGLGRDVLGNDALAPEGEVRTESFALGVLEDYPQVALTSFGDAAGNFLMYRRTPDASVHTKRIQRDTAGVTTTWIRRDPTGQVVAREVVENDGYDPRTRPWYQGAVDFHQAYWSDVYVFFTSRQPGITVSLPVPGPDGDVAAVYGMDITLESISNFLSRLTIGRTGQALVINEHGRLVAFPDLAKMLLAEDGKLRLATVEELDDPALERAFARFRVEGGGRRVIDVQGTRYLSTVTSLEAALGRPWWVMIVVPEEDFTIGVESNYRTQMLADLVVLVIAAVLAVLVVAQGVRADNRQRQADAKQASMDRQMSTLASLLARGDLGTETKGEALRHVTEGVADALGVARVAVWRWRDDRSALVCEDSYDRRSGGHTEGMELQAAALPGLVDSLDRPMVVLDVAQDSRTRALEQDFFRQLGVSTVVSAPVGGAGKAQALLWVEDVARDADWAGEALSFLIGIAGILGHQRWPEATADAAAVAAPLPVAGAAQVPRTPRMPAPGPTLHTASLSKERTRRMHAAAGGGDADLFEQVTVLVLLLDDAEVWARQSGDGPQAGTCMEVLMREIQAMSRELGVPYVKAMGTRIVCAAGFDEAGQAESIGRLALGLETACTRLLTGLDHQLAFRMGIDTGPAMGAAVGQAGEVYNLWGDAVSGAEAMAVSAPAGSIQVSACVYSLLHGHFLLAHRGHYYVHGLGESSIYLLLGGP